MMLPEASLGFILVSVETVRRNAEKWQQQRMHYLRKCFILGAELAGLNLLPKKNRLSRIKKKWMLGVLLSNKKTANIATLGGNFKEAILLSFSCLESAQVSNKNKRVMNCRKTRISTVHYASLTF